MATEENKQFFLLGRDRAGDLCLPHWRLPCKGGGLTGMSRKHHLMIVRYKIWVLKLKKYELVKYWSTTTNTTVYRQCFFQLWGKPCHIYQKLCCFLQSMPWSDIENNKILNWSPIWCSQVIYKLWSTDTT